MNSIRKSKLFRREKMQPLKPKDYLKVVAIVGIITIPILVGLAV
jgi:hypothetical protein